MIDRLKFRGKATSVGALSLGPAPAQNMIEWKNGDWIKSDVFVRASNNVAGTYKFFQMLASGQIDPATVGQWTGLKDSKGVDIYEGDVIVGRDESLYNSDLYEPTAVIWREGVFCCEYWHSPIDNRCEVIGTIHDEGAAK